MFNFHELFQSFVVEQELLFVEEIIIINTVILLLCITKRPYSFYIFINIRKDSFLVFVETSVIFWTHSGEYINYFYKFN